MKCPSCQVAFSAPVPQCPNCNFTLAQIERKFGIVPYFARYLTDRAGELSSREVDKLRALLQLFQRKFPQLLFSVLVADLGPNFSISEYAFWLINRARFSALDAVGPKNFDLLLIVDPESEAAALIVGYGLEEYLSEQDLHDALVTMNEGFRLCDFALGIRQCIECVIERLRESAVEIEQHTTPAIPTQAPDTQ